MFLQNGLKNLGEYSWQRALLSIGDYLLPSRRNYSFLVNSSTDQASWKRLLRGTGPEVHEARKILHCLWDSLDMNRNLGEQLDEIIKNAMGMEPWREVLVQTPNAIDYCDAQSIRWESAEQVYLLKKFQMNGTHAELFTYCLYQTLSAKRNQLQPLRLDSYMYVSGTDIEPCIVMTISHQEFSATLQVHFTNGNFTITIDTKSVENHPEILEKFCSFGFQQGALLLLKTTSRTEVESTLFALAKTFAATSNNEVK